ncbi:MAG: DNA polymerase III subunit delta [Chloroflexi bacterium]|nr:MAG: DNA polymerase III subunit delta [Chloroflexota bacterium]
MAETTPVVYILYGEDEYAITQFVAAIVAKLGDRSMADMNTTRLDGRTASFEELETAAVTMPFLVSRRLVILTNPLHKLASAANQPRFQALLERLPSYTALVLIEYRSLTEDSDRKKGKINWLETWAVNARGRAMLKPFPLLKGLDLAKRIQEMARTERGEIELEAAFKLAELSGEDTMVAFQEIQKLLAYTNYSRPISLKDVDYLVEDQGRGNIFAMVDAIGNGKGEEALKALHRLIEEDDPLMIFGMVVRQFRQLLLTREVLDQKGNRNDVASALRIQPWLSERYMVQARRFTMDQLEAIYHHLLELDEAMKTSEISAELALDTFIAALTHSPSPNVSR